MPQRPAFRREVFQAKQRGDIRNGKEAGSVRRLLIWVLGLATTEVCRVIRVINPCFLAYNDITMISGLTSLSVPSDHASISRNALRCDFYHLLLRLFSSEAFDNDQSVNADVADKHAGYISEIAA